MRFNEQRYRQMSSSPTGTVGLHMKRVGVKIEAVAKVIATEEKLVRTGRFRSSLAWAFERTGGGISIKVGSNAKTRDGRPLLGLLEHGTPAHRIPLQGTANPMLYWTHGADRGWVVPTRPLPFVNHPGTRAYRVIGRAVERVLKGGVV